MIDLQFEDDIGRVTRGGVSVMLPKSRYRLLRVLADANGEMVKSRDIVAKVYGHPDDRSVVLIRVQVAKVRKAIAPLGLEIVGVKQLGYGLAEARI